MEEEGEKEEEEEEEGKEEEEEGREVRRRGRRIRQGRVERREKREGKDDQIDDLIMDPKPFEKGRRGRSPTAGGRGPGICHLARGGLLVMFQS